MPPLQWMPDAKVTREKIQALLGELRSWEPDERRRSLHELAEMFDLGLFVVDRIARSDGLELENGGPREGDDVDPNATTQEIDMDDVRAADADD